MIPLNRDDLQLISRHSNLSATSIDKTLKEAVYNDSKSWKRFLSLLFITLGTGFTLAGIIFFFAYNWADLNKFVKLGMLEGLIIIAVLLVLTIPMKELIKNCIITAAAVLVGALFAVFGQIYQTGANAYDFFLGWTMCITIWVLATNFAPLWLIFIALINTTIYLYNDQVATGLSTINWMSILFALNSVFVIASLVIKKLKPLTDIPFWFSNTISLAAVTFATIGIIIGIFDYGHFYNENPLWNSYTSFWIFLLVTMLLYALGIWYGLKARRAFYLSVISFSIILIISGLIGRSEKSGSESFILFLIAIFIISSVTILIRSLLNLQKKWNNE